MKKNSILLAAVLAAMPILGGCATVGEGMPNLLTTDQELQLGAQMAEQVEEQEKVYEGEALQTYVKQIGQRLARHAPRQDVEYEFTVIDEPDAVNAFALPGGHLYVYTGLMKLSENEAELASVMAHEIAHVAAEHHGEQMTRQYGVEFIRSILLGDEAGRTAQMVSGIIEQGLGLRYSREQEREADSLGMEILFRAGYKPEAMVGFMEKMHAMEEQRGGGPPLPFLSSHPATSERIANLRTQTTRYPLEWRMKSPVYSERYQQMTAPLRQ